MTKKQTKLLQYMLKKVLKINLVIDGIAGQKTTRAVYSFQKKYNLVADGVAGPKTLKRLEEAYEFIRRIETPIMPLADDKFVVFVDAGHGGLDDRGQYLTAGKRAYHNGLELHGNGHYYEGYENRLVAELFIQQCAKHGITCVRTYHPYYDTTLKNRVDLVKAWLRRGYYGYLHSFHSNAISVDNSLEKLENTRGFIVFTDKRDTLSDSIASRHWNHVNARFSGSWRMWKQDYKDGDPDFEADFYILKHLEDEVRGRKLFGAILDEWGFHTSSADARFIIQTRGIRAKICRETAQWTRKFLQEKAK